MLETKTPIDTEATFVRTRWWWVRHAPVRDDGGRIYGQVDLGCECSDQRVFSALANKLPLTATWIASPLKRARQTAEAIWTARGGEAPALEQDPDLAEQHLGDWQGMDRAAFFAARPMDPSSYWFAPASERAPGGESFDDVAVRVRRAVERWTELHSGGDIVAVSHGGPIKAAVAMALNMEPKGGLAFAVDNCALTRLDYLKGRSGSGWRVAFVNLLPPEMEGERKLG